MKTFEQYNGDDNYYAIRWLSLSTNKFDGELEGNFRTTDDVLKYIEQLDFERYGEEFKIVKVKEIPISKEKVKMWKEGKKYNL